MRPVSMPFVQSRISGRCVVVGKAVCWGALAAVLLAGCGDGKIIRYPVTGSVRVDGQPAADAMVVFCPVEGEDEFMRERPFSRTDADGKFELRTFEPGDGAPAGKYSVMVRWLVAAPANSPNPEEEVRGGRGGAVVDRLRGKYANPETSGLTATVEKGNNELPPFELSSR